MAIYNRVKIPSEITHMYAIGSGSMFAMAAMMLGKSAAQAVNLASKLDLYTGGKIENVMIENGKRFNHRRYEI